MHTGCSTTSTTYVSAPGSPTFSIAVKQAACFNALDTIKIVNLSGGTSNYDFVWSAGTTITGIDSLTAVVNASGTYTVTVTDSGNCSLTQAVSVNHVLALTIATSSTNITCFGSVNGAPTSVASGGTSPYSYAWSNGALNSSINTLAAGTYTVTPTDANGCTATTSVVITSPAAMYTISTSSTPATCGLCNGTGTSVVTGGTSPYTYLWSNGQTSVVATGLCAGNNFVVVTDANGCTINVCVKVSDAGSFGITLNSPTYAGGYNIRCNCGNDGSINLTPSVAGTYTYLWSANALSATTEDVFGLSAGTYTVTVSNGICTQTGTITLTASPAIVITPTVININCNGGNNGSIAANVTGGAGPYSYQWNTGQTTQTVLNLSPQLSIVITVCDSAAAETCPLFPAGGDRQPVKVHWSYPDPSNAEGGDAGKRRAFELTRQAIGYRMLQLLALPLETLDRDALRAALTEVGAR